jgi:hypothetical protein
MRNHSPTNGKIGLHVKFIWGNKMKLIIRFLPLILVILGVLNYMFFAKDSFLTIVLLIGGVIAATYSLIKKRHKLIALLSIATVIGLVSLFIHLVNSGV